MLISKSEEALDEVLLVWNADWRTPSWSLPGGARDPGEALAEAAVREVREETGVDIRVTGFIDLYEIIGLGGRIHLVIYTFRGQVAGGELVSNGSSEPAPGGVTAARWFPMADAMKIEAVARVLADESAAPGALACRWGHKRERVDSRGRTNQEVHGHHAAAGIRNPPQEKSSP